MFGRGRAIALGRGGLVQVAKVKVQIDYQARHGGHVRGTVQMLGLKALHI
jgi:hypothetical protein